MRKTVKDFSRYMEMVLKENDHKGGWDSCTKEYLRDKLHEEIDELIIVLRTENKSLIRKEAADVANIAMMIWDQSKFSNW